MKRSGLESLKIVSLILLIIGVFTIWMTNDLLAQPSGKNPVMIGVLTPLSPPGDVAGGKRIVWAAELAIKYINEETGGILGGRPVALAVADDAGTPAEGIAGFRRLVQKDGVVAIVGQLHSSVCLAVTHISKELGVPIFATSASSPKITETNYPTVFSVVSLSPSRSKFYIDFAKKMGWKRVAVMGEDTDYGTGFAEWIKKYGEEAGMEVSTTIYPRTITDLTPALLKIKSWKADILVNVAAGTSSYLMVNQAYDIGFFPSIPMLTTYEFPTRPEFWDAVGHKGKYILYTAYYKPGMPITRPAEWMVSRYKQLHGEPPTAYELNAFGEILIVAQALNMARSDDPGAVTKALSTGTFTDWSGSVKFEDLPGMNWHNVSPPILILQQTEVRQNFTDSKLVWPSKFGGDGKIERP